MNKIILTGVHDEFRVRSLKALRAVFGLTLDDANRLHTDLLAHGEHECAVAHSELDTLTQAGVRWKRAQGSADAAGVAFGAAVVGVSAIQLRQLVASLTADHPAHVLFNAAADLIDERKSLA